MIYVWFDALANYITALDYADEGPRYRRYWIDNPRRVHVIGKGILRFHAVYWPAFLLSAGVPLPTTILVHGYLTVEGQKISKSLGNTIDPLALVAGLRPGRAALLPAAPHAGCRRQRLLSRPAGTRVQQRAGRPTGQPAQPHGEHGGEVLRRDRARSRDVWTRLRSGWPNWATALRARVRAAVERLALHEAVAAIWELIGAANKYVVEVRPGRWRRRARPVTARPARGWRPRSTP